MPTRKTFGTGRKATTFRTARNNTRTATNWYSCNSPKFNAARQECQWRIASYRTIFSQFTGGRTNFSPTVANKWIRYINNGTRVYQFNNNEFARYFGRQWAAATPTAAKQFIRRKFGAGIKDVTRGKNGTWLIATTRNVTGRPFSNHNWT